MARKRDWRIRLLLLVLAASLLTVSCTAKRRPKNPANPKKQTPKQTEKQVKKPRLPRAIRTGGNKEPRLKVYIVKDKKVQEMPFEDYVAGVVAGEMKNDWPEESIKAQAIIARTFVLQFVDEKGKSRYGNAHISTDVEEAQAWNAEEVNDRVRKAVRDTRGQVIVYDGKFARAWFHSNAGGRTATPMEGLNYEEKEPPYIRVVDSPDMGDKVEDEAKSWSAKFPKTEVLAAAKESGKPVRDFHSISIGKKGPSGRAVTIKLDDTEVSAPELRRALDPTKMRSNLLDRVALEGDQVVMSGKGFGHGVGMSQWGARTMAEQGKSAQDIINHYFRNVDVVKMWK